MIDLHLHSTFSDGSLTPEQIAEQAREIGLTAVALTDHDSTDGLPRFLAACARAGVIGIPGVEISADVKRGTLHMLGYFIDSANARLQSALGEIREGRASRNLRILEKLNGLGVNLSMAEVAACAGGDVVGRPHFAQALVARGVVASKDDAFEQYLAKGRPAYVDRFRLSPEESIAMIAGAGGLAVLSHPSTLQLDGQALRAYARELAGFGLGGIEAYYSEHSPDQTREYLQLAADLGVVATGGSDFHGIPNPAIRMGCGFGSLRVPDAIVGQMQAKLAGGQAASNAHDGRPAGSSTERHVERLNPF